MIKKAIIPAAGMGTRLLPATKEQPKEMLPILIKSENGKIVLKPMLQAIFEHLFNLGIREFCFITGKTKRAIENHFTSDSTFLETNKNLESVKNRDGLEDLLNFYNMLKESTIFWVNQPAPKGFGDAVLTAKNFIRDENFLVFAGDDYIISSQNNYYKRLLRIHGEGAAATIIVTKVKDPTNYGVIEADLIRPLTYRVKSIIEKPKDPPSNLAVVAVYLFNPIIFDALEKTPFDKGGEKQLTDAIQLLIDWGLKVYAVGLSSREFRVDIGTVESYYETLTKLYKYYTRSSPKW